MFPGFFGMEYYEDSQRIDRSTVINLMQKDEVAYNLWQKAERHQVVGWVALGAQVGFLVLWANQANNGNSTTAPAIGAIGATLAGIGFSLSSADLRKRSILAYNQGLEATSLRLGPTSNGLGLVVHF